jgi:hypothetical protein
VPVGYSPGDSTTQEGYFGLENFGTREKWVILAERRGWKTNLHRECKKAATKSVTAPLPHLQGELFIF